MMRSVSVVLTAAVVLQTVGCSSWQPLARVNEVPDETEMSSMRIHVLGKLIEGMAVKIRIREGTPAPIKGQVIECIIQEIGDESLTLIPITDHIRGTVKREFRLHFADTLHIEYRKFEPGLTTFIVAFSAGATLALVLFTIAYAGAFSE